MVLAAMPLWLSVIDPSLSTETPPEKEYPLPPVAIR
jgi:hypothetical protein